MVSSTGNYFTDHVCTMKLFSCSVSKEPGWKDYSYSTSLHLSLFLSILHSATYWTTITGRSSCTDCHKFLGRQHQEVIPWSYCGSKQSGFGTWEQCVSLTKQYCLGKLSGGVDHKSSPDIPWDQTSCKLGQISCSLCEVPRIELDSLLEGKCCYGNMHLGQKLNTPCVDVSVKFKIILKRVYSITW